MKSRAFLLLCVAVGAAGVAIGGISIWNTLQNIPP